MDLNGISFSEISSDSLDDLYAKGQKEDDFIACLLTALSESDASYSTIAGIRKVFRHGIRLLQEHSLPELTKSSEATDFQGIIPEEDITQQDINACQGGSPMDDGDDITSFHNAPLQTEANSDDGDRKSKAQYGDSVKQPPHYPIYSVDQDALDRPKNTPASKSASTMSLKSQSLPSPNSSTASNSDDTYLLVGSVFKVLKLWFEGVRIASDRREIDYAARIFGLPEEDLKPNQQDLSTLLITSKNMFEKATTELSTAYIEALKTTILLIHEILHVLYLSMALESSKQGSRDFLVIKSLIHTFFQMNLSLPINQLLQITSQPEDLTESDGEKDSEPLRISYDTLMRLYTIYFTLASCPMDLLIVDKMSLSLDITASGEASANVYKNTVNSQDFNEFRIQQRVNLRIVPLLTSIFNYYYQLHPDLLDGQTNYSSMIGWITGKGATPSLYMSIDKIGSVAAYPEHSSMADKYNPFLYETERFEYAKKLRRVGNNKGTDYAVSSPTYLLLLLAMYHLIHNHTFSIFLTQRGEKEVFLLDLWLCVSSYVHHYQYKSRVNVLGARLSLLVLLKLTSKGSETLPALRDYKIDESKWKICRHKRPIIPQLKNREKRTALMYIIDIVQIDLRFNLNKKLDFENCKIALCVLYQVLIFAEEFPFEDLRPYCWNELFKTLLNFIKFVHKHHNEEDLKYIVEEVFSIFEIVLGPALGGLVELSMDKWIFGKHVVKTFNDELYYILLENYDTLSEIFDKLIIKRENFRRVDECFSELKKYFETAKNGKEDSSEIKNRLSEIKPSMSKDSQMTKINFQEFNYSDSFKFMNNERGFGDVQKPKELVELFKLLYSNDWTCN